MKTNALVACAMVATLGACSSGPPNETARPAPSGPPEPEISAIESHAAQFAREVPERPAGSQQEQIAATYILGHLQQAGYPARLDGVPVADLVSSTNVIATPPEGAEARFLVAVAYDTPPGQARGAESIGVFLEVARALSAQDLDHPVEFVALGAEFAARGEGNLGSRAMARLLEAEDSSPEVIYLAPSLVGEGLTAAGPLSEDLGGDTGAGGPSVDPVARAAVDVYEAAGFEVTLVDGSPEVVAERLTEFLSDGLTSKTSG